MPAYDANHQHAGGETASGYSWASRLREGGKEKGLLLGVGSSSALWGVQLSRPLAWALGAALLALGVALALHSSRSCAVGAARWRQPALLASGALAYALLGALLPVVAARQLEAAAPVPASLEPAAAPTRRLTLNVAKMECLPCVTALQGLLRKIPPKYDAQIVGDARLP